MLTADKYLLAKATFAEWKLGTIHEGIYETEELGRYAYLTCSASIPTKQIRRLGLPYAWAFLAVETGGSLSLYTHDHGETVDVSVSVAGPVECVEREAVA